MSYPQGFIKSIAGVLPNMTPLSQKPDVRLVESKGSLSSGASVRNLIWRVEKTSEIVTLMKKSLLAATEQCGMAYEEIDYILISQVWGEHLLYPEPFMLSRALSLSCPVVSVNSGTSGGTTALEIADALLAKPEHSNIAIIAGCTYAHRFRHDDPNKSLLSDGVACAIIGKEKGIKIRSTFTVNTSDYGSLLFDNEDGSINYPHDSALYLRKQMGNTIEQVRKGIYEKTQTGVDIFHAYDPVDWIYHIMTEKLDIPRDKVVKIYDKYGSLGPAQNFFGLIEALSNPAYSSAKTLLLIGFGPAATATGVMLELAKIPHSIHVTSSELIPHSAGPRKSPA